MIHGSERTVALCLLAIGARPVLSYDSVTPYQITGEQVFESVNDNCPTSRRGLCAESTRTNEVEILHKGTHLEMPQEFRTVNEEDRDKTESESNIRKSGKRDAQGRLRNAQGRFTTEHALEVVDEEDIRNITVIA